MSITVSMAGGNTNVQNMNPMMGQMQMSSLQMPGMNTVCPEQVSGTTGTLATPTHTPSSVSHHPVVHYSRENQVCSYLPKVTKLLFLSLSFDNYYLLR